MLFSSFAKLLLGSATTLLAVVDLVASLEPLATCTVTAGGGDDAPALLLAVGQCPVTTIPKGTILNIATRLNMTGLTNKAIVRCLNLLLCALADSS